MSFDKTTQAILPQHEVTSLHLFRHGKVDTGGVRRAYGHSNYPLSELGIRQTQALVAFARQELPRPAGVISSDLGRCLALAEPLAESLDVPLIAHHQLREQYMGDWEGRSWAALSQEDLQRTRDYWEDYLNTAPPGGESYQALFDRVGAWWESELSTLWGRRWFVVTHIGVLRALTCRFLGVSPSEALRFAPMYGSHTQFLISTPGAVLQVLGEVPGGLAEPIVGTDRRQLRGDRPPRLALSGSAGIGKTTLARALAERFAVPYIPEGMRERIEGGLKLHEVGHDDLKALLLEIWDEQLALEDEAIRIHGGFVSDRSCWDFAAFWLYYHFSDDESGTASFFQHVRARAPTYDRIFLLPWGVLPLEADGVRSSNPWLQRHYQATVEGLLHREQVPARLSVMPALSELDARVRWAIEETKR